MLAALFLGVGLMSEEMEWALGLGIAVAIADIAAVIGVAMRRRDERS